MSISRIEAIRLAHSLDEVLDGIGNAETRTIGLRHPDPPTTRLVP